MNQSTLIVLAVLAVAGAGVVYFAMKRGQFVGLLGGDRYEALNKLSFNGVRVVGGTPEIGRVHGDPAKNVVRVELYRTHHTKIAASGQNLVRSNHLPRELCPPEAKYVAELRKRTATQDGFDSDNPRAGTRFRQRQVRPVPRIRLCPGRGLRRRSAGSPRVAGTEARIPVVLDGMANSALNRKQRKQSHRMKRAEPALLVRRSRAPRHAATAELGLSLLCRGTPQAVQQGTLSLDHPL